VLRTPRVFVTWVYAWLTDSEAPRKTHSQRVSGSGVTAPIRTSAESSLPSDVEFGRVGSEELPPNEFTERTEVPLGELVDSSVEAAL
jgi:hypothetical protein